MSGGLREPWEANAARWIAWARAPGHDSYWRFHRDQFLELLPPPGRLAVDLGCGEGRLPRDLKARGYDVVGVEASPTLAAAAREADPSIEVHCADAAAVPLLYSGQLRARHAYLVLLIGLITVAAAIATTHVGHQWAVDLGHELGRLLDSVRGRHS